jgi:hypothetical protein
MKNDLLKNRDSLKILTAVSFLLLYKPGDTISAFIFMLLIILPFLIKNNMAGIVEISNNVAVNIAVNLLFVGLIYVAVFYLIRSGIKRKHTTIDNISCCFSIVIICSYGLRVFYSEPQTVFSFITIAFFSLCTATTLYILLVNIYSKRI